MFQGKYVPIIRRKQLYQYDIWYLSLHLAYQTVTHSEWQTRGVDLVQLFSPDDGHIFARNMLRIEINIQRKKFCTKLVLFARWFRINCAQLDIQSINYKIFYMYREIHKSLRDFRPLRYSSRDGHAEGEHVNRGRHTPIFCPKLQVLDMSTLGDAADVKPVITFLPYALQNLAVNSSDRLHDPSSQPR
jgi:hypothetical protein